MEVKIGNHVFVIGGATRDAEVKKVGKNDTVLCTFSLGLGEKNGKKIYANCNAWGRLSGPASKIEKADIVFAVGEIDERTGSNGKQYKNLNVEWLNIVKPETAEVGDDSGNDSGGISVSSEDSITISNDDDLPF